jgi:hypothetical protein
VTYKGQARSGQYTVPAENSSASFLNMASCLQHGRRGKRTAQTHVMFCAQMKASTPHRWMPLELGAWNQIITEDLPKSHCRMKGKQVYSVSTDRRARPKRTQQKLRWRMSTTSQCLHDARPWLSVPTGIQKLQTQDYRNESPRLFSSIDGGDDRAPRATHEAGTLYPDHHHDGTRLPSLRHPGVSCRRHSTTEG